MKNPRLTVVISALLLIVLIFPLTQSDKLHEKLDDLFAPHEPSATSQNSQAAAKIHGVIFDDNHKNELSAFFEELSKNQHYYKIVVLTADNHADQNFLANLSIKNFPDAQFKNLTMQPNPGPAEIKTFGDELKNLPDEILILAPVRLKLSPDPALKNFELKFAHNVLENFDLHALPNLPFQETKNIKILLQFLQNRKAGFARAYVAPAPPAQAQAQPHVAQAANADSATAQSQSAQNPFLLEFFSDGPSPTAQNRSIFLVAFGDIMLDRLVASRMKTYGEDYPFANMDPVFLQANDLLIANLEGPITKKRLKSGKEIAFRFAPEVAPLLKKYFFDIFSNANNHAIDMGWNGFNETREFMQQAGMIIFGNPRDINDDSVAGVQVRGNRIAFLGLDDVDFKVDEKKALQEIRDLTAQGYMVIPFLHWGIEYMHHPSARQTDLAHKFIDAGAVAVLGCHPHVVQSSEEYKGRPVFYSLGNAIFDQDFSPATQEGLAVAMILHADTIETTLAPIKIDRSQMRLMTEDERRRFFNNYQGLFAGKVIEK